MGFKDKKYLTVKNLFFTCENKGFSLLEVVFSIGIVTVGIVSILTLFSYNLKNEINNKNKLIAIYLAQESIEIARQNRDNTWFGGAAGFLGETEFLDGDVIVFPDQHNNIRKGWKVETPGDVAYRKVYINKGYYLQKNAAAPASWEETGFGRYLEIDNSSDGTVAPGCDITKCARIISHVSFNGTEIATVTAYLYDEWY